MDPIVQDAFTKVQTAQKEVTQRKEKIAELQGIIAQAIDEIYNRPSMREDDRNLQKGLISSARVALEDPKRELGYVESALEQARKDYKELLEARAATDTTAATTTLSPSEV